MNASTESRLIDPPPPKDIRESLAADFERLELGDAFIRAGLRIRLGPDADIEPAYRQWNREFIERAAEEKACHFRKAECDRVADDR